MSIEDILKWLRERDGQLTVKIHPRTGNTVIQLESRLSANSDHRGTIIAMISKYKLNRSRVDVLSTTLVRMIHEIESVGAPS